MNYANLSVAPGARAGAAQPRGNDNRGGANRVGVRGRFKD